MVLAWVWAHALCVPAMHAAEAPVVLVMELEGSVNPGALEYLKTAIGQAENRQAACLVVLLDTPGGLADSMRDMVKAIWAAQPPVVVYVAPSGARASSAGVMLTLAADIAAMAPGTHIGAAHPVGIGSDKMDDTVAAKVTSDMAAYARSVAERRGRNGDWAERAVRESISATETEGCQSSFFVLPDHFVEQSDQHATSTGADGMSEGYASAVDVDSRGIELKFLEDGHR